MTALTPLPSSTALDRPRAFSWKKAANDDRLQPSPTEVTGFTRDTLLVRRSGRKVKVSLKPTDRNDPKRKSGAL